MALLAGSSLISHCGPHFHDTYTIACMRRGRADVRVRGISRVWDDGGAFLGNPYEIHAGGDRDHQLVYDVCYPGQDLMLEMLEMTVSSGRRPYFENVVLPAGDHVRSLAAIVADLAAPEPHVPAGSREQDLIDFFRMHRHVFCVRLVDVELGHWVSSAVARLEEAVEKGTDAASSLDRIGCSRSYLIRQFRKVTGVTPGAYLLQLRLARARRLLCDGSSIADTAAAIGFSDQPHLTREFKRVNGTTPGKFMRDVMTISAHR